MTEGQSYIMLDLNQLPQFSADHMFVICHRESSIEQFYQKLATHPTWSKLPAVSNKQVYPLELEHFWVDDACSLLKQLPLIVEAAACNRG